MTYANTGTPNLRPPDRATRWQDPANLIIAIWFFISPWVLQFGYTALATGTPTVAAWNAWVLSVIVFLVALAAMGHRHVRGQEWFNLWLGVWIFIAPWVLGFAARASDAAWDHWIVGALVFLVSASALTNSRPVERIDVHAPMHR
jgi:hypothetical protein